MKNRRLIFVGLVLSLIGSFLATNVANAWGPVEQKILGYGIYKCYTSGIMKGETTVQNVQDGYKSLVEVMYDGKVVFLPTKGYDDKLHTSERSNLSCRELFGGVGINGKEFSGLLKLSGMKGHYEGNLSDYDKKALLETLGYTASDVESSDSGSCLAFWNKGTKIVNNRNTTIEGLSKSICSTNGSVEDSNILIADGLTEGVNFSKSNNKITVSLAGVEKKIEYNLREYADFSGLKSTIITDVQKFYSEKDNNRGIKGNGAANSYYGFIGIDKSKGAVGIEERPFNDSTLIKYSIANVGHGDGRRSQAAITAANNLLGAHFNSVDDMKFTDAELQNLLYRYLNNFYGTEYTCELEHKESLMSAGYVEIPLLNSDKSGFDVCLGSPSKNGDESVYAINKSDLYFDGTTWSFKDIADMLMKMFHAGHLVVEDLNEINDTEEKSNYDLCSDVDLAGQGWNLCSTMKNLEYTATGLEKMVEEWLTVKSDYYNGDSATHEVWEVMRNIANVIMIIILLVIIFSQLTGVGIDNYGIKKMLPKLILMAVLINLSFILCEIAVDVSNIFGVGIRDLFGGLSNRIVENNPRAQGALAQGFISGIVTSMFAATGAAGAASGTIITIATMAASRSPMIIIVVILALAAIIFAVLIFFVMLGARMMIIIGCIAVAPIAFAMYIMPNTQKLFKKWWSVFQAALIIFPICGAASGISHILKAIVLTTNETTFAMSVVAMIAPFLVFFILPTLLKSSMAALSVLGGALTAIGSKVSSGFSSAQNAVMQTEMAKAAMKEGHLNNMSRRIGYDRKTGALTDAGKKKMAEVQKKGGVALRRFNAQYGQLQAAYQDEDKAKTGFAMEDYRDKGLEQLDAEWVKMWENGDPDDKLSALTNVMVARYGSSATNKIAERLGGAKLLGDGEENQKQRKSMRVLQRAMDDNTTFASVMKTKNSDAYQMISNGGRRYNEKTKEMEYTTMDWFTEHNTLATQAKDWASSSTDALKRSIDAKDEEGNYVMSTGMLEKLLDSDAPAEIKAGLQSEDGKTDILKAELYKRKHAGTQQLSPEEAVKAYDEEQKKIMEAKAKISEQHLDTLKNIEKKLTETNVYLRSPGDTDGRNGGQNGKPEGYSHA